MRVKLLRSPGTRDWTDLNGLGKEGETIRVPRYLAKRLIDAHLATIDSQAENDAIAGAIGSVGASWIGLTDAFSEGTFLWFEGEGEYLATTFLNWAGGQPDGQPNSNGDCARMAADGTWTDEECAEARPFVCEYNF